MDTPTPTHISVYASKPYSLVSLAALLAFGGALMWQGAQGFRSPLLFWAVAVFILGTGAVVLLRGPGTDEPMLRVDEAGIYDRRGPGVMIAWADIIAVERLPKVQHLDHEMHFCVKDAWRPLRICVRNPDKHLSKVKTVLRRSLSPQADLERGWILIEFMGLAPGSGMVEACIRQHLARRGSAQAAS